MSDLSDKQLQAAIRARALADGHTLEQETRIALEFYLAHQHNQGEMRHPDDIVKGGGW